MVNHEPQLKRSQEEQSPKKTATAFLKQHFTTHEQRELTSRDSFE